ncbi:hypothetical protein RJ640_015414 [Escallonia rubra]|uniref:FT-like protein n=1 Tax=Escallonia rubra TaxID=112253 RepID=A0AA88RRZ8_9ASTE|nr:hypothetical protein RJ640_015414 [Escallonia rubra]
MSINVDPLVVGRVIGDVVDPFVPTATMSVYYSSKHVTNGCDIKPSVAVSPPRVTIYGDPHQLYTLVMTDPDAPSPSEPSLRELVHWVVTDIPGRTTPTQGKELMNVFVCLRSTLGIVLSTLDFRAFLICEYVKKFAGMEVLPYLGPRPPVGIHRFIFVLFQQRGPLGFLQPPVSRTNFSTRTFATQLNLGMPVATVYFNSRKEPINRRR